MFPRGHAGFALLFCLPVLAVCDAHIALLSMTICAIWFSIVPDLDVILHYKTQTFNHRGFTHTIWFILVINTFFSLSFMFLKSHFILSTSEYTAILVGINIGLTTHIIGDILNEDGVNPLYIPKLYHGPNIRFFKIRSDSYFWNNFLFSSGSILVIIGFIL